MDSSLKMGIWLDHASAHLMPFENGSMQTKVIESKFSHLQKTESLAKSEHGMHQKEQQMQADFYEKLGDEIINYESILLFGPTDAKLELFNRLRADRRFEKIKIETRASLKMSENQEHAFVRDYFSQL